MPVLPVTIQATSLYLLSRQTNGLGNYTNIVGTAPLDGTQVYQWNPLSGSYDVYDYFDGFGWSPFDPIAAVGEPIWISAGGLPPPTPPADSFVVYQGLVNTSLGTAALTVSGNQLTVANIGSSGQDGVSIAVAPNTTLDVGWLPLDPSDALPVGASLQTRMIGTTGYRHQRGIGIVDDYQGGNQQLRDDRELRAAGGQLGHRPSP